MTLVPGPARFPARPPSAAPLGSVWFLADRTSVELVSDDPILLARTAGTFTPHHAAVPTARWLVTVLRTASLDAAPAAFVGTPVFKVAGGVSARYHRHPQLGDSWLLERLSLIVHNNPRSRWVGIRYTHAATARDWTPAIIAQLLATPMYGTLHGQQQA